MRLRYEYLSVQKLWLTQFGPTIYYIRNTRAVIIAQITFKIAHKQ